jgi:hypothetical protein
MTFPQSLYIGDKRYTEEVDVGSVIRTARKIGDPIMIELMELDTNIMGTSNFQNVTLATPNGGFNAISQFQKLDYSALEYLVKIQPVDNATLNQKMQFLVGLKDGTPDRPYWTDIEWQKILYNKVTPFVFNFGTIVFGGQKLRVKSVKGVPVERQFMCKYHGKSTAEMITFYEVVGLRKKDWGRPIAELRAEGYIQIATWATMGTNKYNELWHSGTTLHPIWSHLDYPVNTGASPLYIDKKFLEPVV